jgi:hypothetical protein
MFLDYTLNAGLGVNPYLRSNVGCKRKKKNSVQVPFFTGEMNYLNVLSKNY